MVEVSVAAIVVAAASTAAVLVGHDDKQGKPARADRGEETAVVDATSVASEPDVTPCDELPPVPRDTEIDTVLDQERGLLTYAYGSSNTTYTIAYRDDPTCDARVDVQRLVAQTPH